MRVPIRVKNGLEKLNCWCLKKWYSFLSENYDWQYVQRRVSKYEGKFGVGLRQEIYPRFFKHFDKDVVIRENCHFLYPEKISLGGGVGINYGCWINGAGGVDVLDEVLIGPYTVIHSANHIIPPKPEPIKESGWEMAKVTLVKNCWIAAHCTVLPGVRIGEGAVIGAGAVVTKDIPRFTIAVGVPASEVRKR